MARKNQITNEKIIEAALTIFTKYGYKGASMRKIAESLGVKAGSLYHHIRSKEELLEKIHDALIDGLLAKSERIISNNSISNKEKLELFIEEILRAMAESKNHATVFFSDYKYLTPPFSEKTNAKRKKYQDFLRELLRRGIDQGEFRPMDTRIISMGIFGMVTWAHTWIALNGRLKVQEIAKMFSAMVLDGVRSSGEALAEGR